jgi:predicted nucleic acid-binding protein
LLIQLATANLFRAKWTERINEEWIQSLLKKRDDLLEHDLRRCADLMNEAVPDSLVSGYEHLIASISLPDEDDRHVVAAAIHARADCIVTYNLKDFPAGSLATYNLEALHPDEFINFQFDLDDASVIVAAQSCCRRLKNPPKTAEEYLDTLGALGLPKTVGALRPFAAVL